MIYVESKVTIDRKPEVVWGFLTDVSLLASWVEGLFEAELVPSSARFTADARIDVAVRVKGKRRDATVEITALRPYTLIAAESRDRNTLLLGRIVVAEATGGTELTVITETIDVGHSPLFGLTTIAGKAKAVEAQVVYDRSLAALKKLVESATLTPYR